ncbi:amidohydrolase family protein [Asticcacaulis sp. 201]|uniref:amidohydrolase family protein n=1 Tax=Asticcacaulis sp. 201 TaxID=3028787 RepID=UPI002916DC2A|nr:amidohydrolase family protein [Asticcacaulis sp. 201]MDV6330687.1 amidohydrolase family protein [Asticcacaulis sp. 201]
MQIIDTHAHFWDVDTIDYPWIEKGSSFDRSFHLANYQAASAGVPVHRMVFVECDAHARHSLTEARWVAGLAEQDPRIQGIVARTSFMSPQSDETLEALTAMPLVRGIRDNIQNNKPGFALQPRFVEGVRSVHRLGLHFELCLKHHQLEETIELVRRCPDGQFVLDHCAKPDIAAGLREPWHMRLRELAALPNVVCKISGLVTEADWMHWQAEDVLWYARSAAEAFGHTRILFGSDWPVNEVAGGYMAWFRLAQSLCVDWSEADRDRFFRRNAEDVYRLGKG